MIRCTSVSKIHVTCQASAQAEIRTTTPEGFCIPADETYFISSFFRSLLARLANQIPVIAEDNDVRAAELRDARGIAEVHVGSWRAAYAGIVPDADLVRLSVDQREQLRTQILSKASLARPSMRSLSVPLNDPTAECSAMSNNFGTASLQCTRSGQRTKTRTF
jgi:hypothetical protein